MLVVVCKYIVDICIIYEILRERIFITDGQLQFIVDSIEIYGITQYVAEQGNQERETATVDTFEEGALTKSHHTCSCTR